MLQRDTEAGTYLIATYFASNVSSGNLQPMKFAARDKCKKSVKSCGPEQPTWETTVGDKCKIMRPRPPIVEDKRAVKSCGSRAPRVGDKGGRQVGDKDKIKRPRAPRVGDKCKITRPKLPRVGDKCGRQAGDKCKIMRSRTPRAGDKCGRSGRHV